MTKTVKLLLLLIVVLLFVIGCGSKVRNVSTYDENIEAEMRTHYNELREHLFDKHENDPRAITQDELYDEYTSLNMRFGPGSAHNPQAEQLRENIRGTVNLDEQTIQYDDSVIEYERTGYETTILNNDTELMDETLERMVRLAEGDYEEVNNSNFNLLITAGWLPLLIFTAGLIGWVKPEWVWYVEGGFRNKDAEPSSTAYTVVKIQSIIAFALTIFLIWLIFQQVVR